MSFASGKAAPGELPEMLISRLERKSEKAGIRTKPKKPQWYQKDTFQDPSE